MAAKKKTDLEKKLEAARKKSRKPKRYKLTPTQADEARKFFKKLAKWRDDAKKRG